MKVLFFGPVRELTGLREEMPEIAAGSTITDLFGAYARRFPRLAAYQTSLVASRNQEFAHWDAALSDGDEVAFLPPVSGG